MDKINFNNMFSASVYEAYIKLYEKMNEIIEQSNELVTDTDNKIEIMKQILDDGIEGIPNEISNQLYQMIENRTIEKIINVNIFNNLNTQIKEKMNKNTNNISIKQINKNLGLIDQSYLSEELKQQIAGNTPINSVPAIGSVTQSMMVKPYLEGKKSKNLFCPDTCTSERFVYYKDGSELINADYKASDYIPVKANEKITLSGNHQQYALFDINKNYVEGDINEKDPKVITPSVDGFIRININIPEGDLITTQLEIGDKATEYENYYKTYLDNNSINERIPKDKLDSDLLVGRKSLNIFNKNDITNGVFINMYTGEEMFNSNYVSSNYIPVSSGETYCVRLRGGGSQGAFYDINKNYISGVNIEYTKNFVSPDNACYFRFAFPSSDLDGQMLSQSDNIITYEEFGRGYLDSSSIGDDSKKLFLSRKKGVITVAKENGNFDNIQSAIDNAGDNDDNPVTIIIYPGVYSKFTVLGGRNISLIGIDKHKCIVRDDYGRYDDPPAEIHVNGLVKGLTFISTHDLDSQTNVDSLRSYAVHCDYEGEATVEFEDCIMISKQNASFGSGLHNNVTIKLTRCELYSETPTESTMTTNGSLFCHSNTNLSTVNQNLIVKDCIIKSKNSYAVYINDVGSGGTMKTTFINNMIWSDELKKSNQAIHVDTPKTGISGDISLTEKSFGNNIGLLNG